LLHLIFVEGDAQRGVGRIQCLSLRGNLDLFRHGADAQGHVASGRKVDQQIKTAQFKLAEAFLLNSERVCSWRKAKEFVFAGIVGSRFTL